MPDLDMQDGAPFSPIPEPPMSSAPKSIFANRPQAKREYPKALYALDPAINGGIKKGGGYVNRVGVLVHSEDEEKRARANGYGLFGESLREEKKAAEKISSKDDAPKKTRTKKTESIAPVVDAPKEEKTEIPSWGDPPAVVDELD